MKFRSDPLIEAARLRPDPAKEIVGWILTYIDCGVLVRRWVRDPAEARAEIQFMRQPIFRGCFFFDAAKGRLIRKAGTFAFAAALPVWRMDEQKARRWCGETVIGFNYLRGKEGHGEAYQWEENNYLRSVG